MYRLLRVATLLLSYIFVCVLPCDIMYNTGFEQVYLCDASKDIPNQCNVFWENNFISFCALEMSPPNGTTNVSSHNTPFFISANTTNYSNTTLHIENITSHNLTLANISYNNNSYNNISHAKNSYTNISHVNNSFTIISYNNISYNNISYNNMYNKTLHKNINNTSNVKNISSNESNSLINITKYNLYFSASETEDSTTESTYTSVFVTVLIIVIIVLMFVVNIYLCNLKFTKKKKSLRNLRHDSKKISEREETPKKVTKEPRPTLKNRSLSMPGKEQPFQKWKKDPFLSRKDTLMNIKKIQDTKNTINNDNITTRTISLEDIILDAPLKPKPKINEKPEYENVLEECEILLSSIRDDEFEDVQEDLPLPPGSPPS